MIIFIRVIHNSKVGKRKNEIVHVSINGRSKTSQMKLYTVSLSVLVWDLRGGGGYVQKPRTRNFSEFIECIW